jgi:hypothetical protein
MQTFIIVIIVIVIVSVFCSLFIGLGGMGYLGFYKIKSNRNVVDNRRDDDSFFEDDGEDGISMSDNPFFKLNISKNELIEAEKELMEQKAIQAKQDVIDKASAKVEYAKKRLEWVKCYSERDCLNMCVRFGDKVRIVKFFNIDYKLSLKSNDASEVNSIGDDTILVFQDIIQGGRTENVKEDEDLNKISQKCITYGDLTRIAKYSDQKLALKMYNNRAYGAYGDITNKDTKFVIEGNSGNVNYGDKIQISKEGIYKLRLSNTEAIEKKDDTHEGSYLMIVKA